MVLSLAATFIVTGETKEKALVVRVIQDAGEELGVVQEGCMVWAPSLGGLMGRTQESLRKESRAGDSKWRHRFSPELGHRCFLTWTTYQNVKLDKLYILFEFQYFLKTCRNPEVSAHIPTGQDGKAAVFEFGTVPAIPKVSPDETERSLAFCLLALSPLGFFILPSRPLETLRPLTEGNSPRVNISREQLRSERRLI